MISVIKYKNRKYNRGFTMIEMLVVIIIIGILATLVLVSVSNVRKKAQATKAKSDLEQFSNAFELAANSGCTKVSFSQSGELTCTPLGSSQVLTLIKLDKLPANAQYAIRFNSLAESNKTELNQDDPTWSNAITDTPILGSYVISTYGFSGDATVGESFYCSDGGNREAFGAWGEPGCACLSKFTGTLISEGCSRMK